MQKDRCIWQMYFFCKTEWRKFQTIAIKHSFHPPELNRVCWNPGNTESWKRALKHANSWKQRRHETLLKLSSGLALTQKAIILSKLIKDLHSLHRGGYNIVFPAQSSEGAGLQHRTWTSPPSVTEQHLPWVSFPNYMELAKAALNPASWLTAAS